MAKWAYVFTREIRCVPILPIRYLLDGFLHVSIKALTHFPTKKGDFTHEGICSNANEKRALRNPASHRSISKNRGETLINKAEVGGTLLNLEYLLSTTGKISDRVKSWSIGSKKAVPSRWNIISFLYGISNANPRTHKHTRSTIAWGL